MKWTRAFGLTTLGCVVSALGVITNELKYRNPADLTRPLQAGPLDKVPTERLRDANWLLAPLGLGAAWLSVRRGSARRQVPARGPGGDLGERRSRFAAPKQWNVISGIIILYLGWVAGTVAPLLAFADIRPATAIGLTAGLVAAVGVPVGALVWAARYLTGGDITVYDRGLVVTAGGRPAAVPWDEVVSLCGMTQGTQGRPAKRRPLWVGRTAGRWMRVSPSQDRAVELAAAVYAAVLPLQMERARAAIRRGEPVTCAGLRVDAGGATRPGGGRLEWRHVGRVALERGRFLVEVRDGRVWWRVNAEATPDVLLFAALAAELRFGGPPATG